jgi:phosphopantothenoylcysteine decarboxylase/phosphopantothenate--cysteine ligase
VAANVALEPPPGVKVVRAGTAADLKQVCEAEFDRADVLLMAAAVADFRPAAPATTKLKKDRGAPQIELEPTEDVLSALSARRRREQVLVGFAAEHGDGALEYARAKLERKHLDAVVVNDISNPEIGFDAPDNEVTVLTAGGRARRIAKIGKDRVAERVLDEVEALRAGKESSDRAVRADPHRVAGV